LQCTPPLEFAAKYFQNFQKTPIFSTKIKNKKLQKLGIGQDLMEFAKIPTPKSSQFFFLI
jgi:predicted GNAT family acetyltransferase